MLAVCKPINQAQKEDHKSFNEIIVTRYEVTEEETKEGILIKKIPHKVNLTRKINETAKLVKTYTAEEKLAELEKVFTK